MVISMENQRQEKKIKVSEEKLNRIYDKLHEFDARIDSLESENSELRRKNAYLETEIEQFKESREDLKEEIEKEVQVLKSQAGHLADKNIEVQETLENIKEIVSEHKENTNSRLAQLESDSDISSTTAETSIDCELDAIKYLDETQIKETFSVDTYRAVVIWENFTEWSENTPGGRTLQSGELRKLLSSRSNSQLAWTQIYRAMACFNDMSPKEYDFIDNNKTGKAIVKTI